MGADKGKKAKIAEGGEEDDGGKLLQFVEKLQEIQDDLEKINEDASDKVLELEQQFNEIRRPVYNKRNDIIKSIPDFWLTAFLSHPVLCDILNDEDQKLFKHLVSLDVEDFKDVKSGYTITFKFSENPFFEDRELTKTFSFSDDGATSITCTPIKWKEGVEITNGDAPNKNSKKRPFPDDSFFTWFSESHQKNPSVPSDTIFDEVAEVIKEDLWPNPLKYFNNEADEEDFDGDDDDEDKESDDDDEDDEQEDEEDDS